jgi:hypothetical protein
MNLPTRIWIWVPVAGIALAVAFSTAMIITALRVRPTRVEAHPFQASALIDGEKERSAAFRRAGLTLAAAPGDRAVILTLGAPAGTDLRGAATVSLWRPDDPALDATITWPDVAAPVSIPLARAGRWRLRLELPAAPGWPDGARTETLISR